MKALVKGDYEHVQATFLFSFEKCIQIPRTSLPLDQNSKTNGADVIILTSCHVVRTLCAGRTRWPVFLSLVLYYIILFYYISHLNNILSFLSALFHKAALAGVRKAGAYLGVAAATRVNACMSLLMADNLLPFSQCALIMWEVLAPPSALKKARPRST